jgi:uncharacterized damage-inducible protein DinB
MSASLEDLIEGLEHSRRHFLKHLEGLREDQWDWKPYPQCKSIRETLQHLITDDRAALESMRSGVEPEYDKLDVSESDVPKLLDMLAASHKELIDHLEDNFFSFGLESEICIWGTHRKLIAGVPYLSSEDYYHAGQVAYIRQATDPDWDYYAAIYG